MTTTPTASPELLDLDKLEALARAATPGPWGLAKITDRSIEHLCPVDRDRLSLLTVVHEGETPYGAVYRDEDANFVAAIHPEQVLTLIALARRAQPYATGGDVPGGLHLAGEGLRPLCGQPESEATQAAPLSEVQIDRIARAYFSEQWAVQHAKDAIHDAFEDARKAATLSPLCGAQHAESGKEVRPHKIAELLRIYDEQGGDWCKIARAVESRYVDAPSAPGTPEAPKPPFPISNDEMAALRRFWECATDGEGYDVEKSMMQRLAEMGLVQRKSGAYYMATEFGLYVLGEYTMERAAQLYGGQEGSESNG